MFSSWSDKHQKNQFSIIQGGRKRIIEMLTTEKTSREALMMIGNP